VKSMLKVYRLDGIYDQYMRQSQDAAADEEMKDLDKPAEKIDVANVINCQGA